MAALSNRTRVPENMLRIQDLSELLKAQFFVILKQACGKSVEKYWLTGVLPAFRDGISPLTATQVISFEDEYHSLCGLTQDDVEAIVKRTLRDLPQSAQSSTLESLERWYDGYRFTNTSIDSENLTLYNPQLVFVHLRNVVSGRPPTSYINEANAVHTSTVLSLVGETGPVTIHSLIDMLSSSVEAKISTKLSFEEIMRNEEIRPKNVTWSLLYYLGIATFHEDSDSLEEIDYLCAPNGTMAYLVSPRMSCLRER